MARIDIFDEYYVDEKRAEDDQAYQSAECTDPHGDGSTCMPGWDGYGYVCIDRLIREKGFASEKRSLS